MAGGKLSPRQKMINLMYLVFIAMLAMQMDKKVLSSFGFMKEKIESSNDIAETNINRTLAGLKQQAQDQPQKFGDLYQKAKKISELSDNTFNYLGFVKDSILADTDEEDKTEYEAMSGGDRVDELFFSGEGYTEMGQNFLASVENYRDQLINILGPDASEGLKSNIRKRFDTSEVKDEDDAQGAVPWLKSRYEGMPMITSLANITQIQGDIRNTESQIYAQLVGNEYKAANQITTNNYKGIVRLDKTAYFAGERVKGEVVLGRYDDELVPTKVTLGNQDITKNVRNGQVILDMPAGNVGDKTFKGSITFMQDGKPQVIPFESEYSVIAKPEDAVISADKMNVVYRGLDNPISISLPGVGDKDIKASAPGLKKLGVGSYVMRPGSGNEVKINVSATLSSGETVNSNKTFRIKDIPAAAGSVRGDFGVVPMPKSSLGNTPIKAELPDFVFDLQLQVQSFTVKVPGQLAIKVNGTQFDARAKKVLAKARRGDVITIFDIKAVESKTKTPIKKVLPVSIQITN